MKKYTGIAISILLIILVVFLYGFAAVRNTHKKNDKIEVAFTNGENLFVTHEMVNNMLIQNLKIHKNQSVESLLLKNLEQAVESNPMVQEAEVFYTIEGNLGALVTQRTPILRVVNGLESFYLDEHGKKMPLSGNYSSRVPIISDLYDKEVSTDLTQMAIKIKNDPFLQKQIIAIKQDEGVVKQFELFTRVGNQTIEFGTIQNFDEKKKKLKAFYQNALNSNTLEVYDTINLKFKNQIVCSKK
jgi:cell division protein FtsQ